MRKQDSFFVRFSFLPGLAFALSSVRELQHQQCEGKRIELRLIDKTEKQNQTLPIKKEKGKKKRET